MGALFAIARMQWRAFLNSMRRGQSRDPIPTLVGALITLTMSFLSLAVGAAMLFVFSMGSAVDASVRFWIVVAWGFGGVLFALISAVSGESHGVADARSLQLFPLAHGTLARLDLASEFLAPSVLMFAPGFVGIALGVLIGQILSGHFIAALPGLAAVVAAFVCNVTLVRIVSSYISTSGRRLREWMMLIFVGGFVAMAYLGPELDRVKESGIEKAVFLLSLVARFTWLGAAGDLATAGGTSLEPIALSNSFSGYAADALILAGYASLLLAVHRRATRRLLSGEGGHHEPVRAAPAAGLRRRALLEHILPAPVFGIAASDLRSMLRIPMMWILLLMPALFGVFVGGRGSQGIDPQVAAEMAVWTLPFAALGAHVLFSAQLFSNVFGIDRDATAHFLLAPVTARELFLGKGLARIAFGSLQVGTFLTILAMRTHDVGREDVLRGYGAWLAAAFWVSAAGQILSIRVPVRMTFGAQKEQRFERAATSMLVQLVVAAVLLPPAAMILGGRLLQGDRGYLAGTITTAVTGIVLWIAVSFVASDMLAARGPDMVDGLSHRG